jgi:hypothetical protein
MSVPANAQLSHIYPAMKLQLLWGGGGGKGGRGGRNIQVGGGGGRFTRPLWHHFWHSGNHKVRDSCLHIIAWAKLHPSTAQYSLTCDHAELYTVPLLGCMAIGQSASLVATADKQSGSDCPLPVFWNILLSMHNYDILLNAC